MKAEQLVDIPQRELSDRTPRGGAGSVMSGRSCRAPAVNSILDVSAEL
jgi:hypothetical protein